MEILSNPIFWIGIIIVMIIMAIIGKLAEGTVLDKNKTENPKEKTPAPEQNRDTWKNENKLVEEKHEVIHKAPTINDWNTMPDNLNQPIKAETNPKNDTKKTTNSVINNTTQPQKPLEEPHPKVEVLTNPEQKKQETITVLPPKESQETEVLDDIWK